MEGKDYRYPVALQWVQGAEELKKVKNALLLYFQSPKQCNGGECAIRDTDCSPGYIVIYFKDKEAQKGVLKKNPHQIPIKEKNTSQDKPPLTLHVFPLDTADPQTMGTAVSSLVGSGDDGASGSSAEADHQQGDNLSSGIPKRGNSSMMDPEFRNGDPKRLHHRRDDSTRHRESEKDRRDGVTEEEEQNNNSSTPGSLTEKDNTIPEHSGISRNGSGRSKKEKSLAAAPPEDNGASRPSADKDHQQEGNQSSGHLQRGNSSLADIHSMVAVQQSPEDYSTRHKEEFRSDRRIDRNEQDYKSNAPKPLRVNGDQSPEYPFPPGNEPRRNSLSNRVSNEEAGSNHPAVPPESFQLFISVTAKLDKKWFTEALQEEIKVKIPSLTIKAKSNVVEVTGQYSEIESVYRYLKRRWEPVLSAEKPPEAPSDQSPTDSQPDQVCFPSALYEYIMEIYRTEMDQIQRRYGVKINHRSAPEGSTFVTFIPQGPDSSPEKAKEKFTDKVQKVMDDWSQVTVDPSVVPLTISDIKERVVDRWSKTLVIQGENMGIILRGPRDELSQVKTFLETTDHKPARPRRAVTISTSDMKTEIQVDVRHMDLLKKLKPNEISDIEKKYNVKMEERSKNGSSFVTFKSTNAAPDLSPHASHSFITLLQKTFFNIQKKEISVKPGIQEGDVDLLQEQLMMAGIVVVMENFKGTVLLIGHPVHVAFAEERLSGNQSMDTSSPSAAAQKKDEPDTCPICLCEIKDKEILDKCKHAYCKGCLQELMAHKPVCAICGVSYGTVTGDQPDGTMSETRHGSSLPGYPGCGTIEIQYNIPGGTQKDNHPHPGRHFSGTTRTAYLPDNKEGKEILSLLRKAFNQKLIFTVGESRTSGATDTVTWNDIHHKTSTTGGPQCFGYPDPDYLNRVRDELKAKGIE